jgi:hypothetical protein
MNYLACIALMMMMNLGRTQTDKGVGNENGILTFQSAEQLVAYGDQLAAEQARIDDQINSKCPKKDDQPDEDVEECRQKAAEELGNAYDKAEKALGFNSLRRCLQDKRDRYLQTEAAESQPDAEPSSHFIGLDQDQSVLTCNGAVKVGDTYYLLTQEGELTFSSREALDKHLSSSPTAAADLAGSKRRLQASLCRTNVHNSGYVYCQERRRRIRFRIGHYWWFFNYRAYAYTACQRRAFFGWFYFPTINFNYARVYGAVSAPQIVGCTIQNNLCTAKHFFNTIAPISSVWAFGFSATHTVCVPTKTKSGWIFGDHYSSCCPNFKFSTNLKF